MHARAGDRCAARSPGRQRGQQVVVAQAALDQRGDLAFPRQFGCADAGRRAVHPVCRRSKGARCRGRTFRPGRECGFPDRPGAEPGNRQKLRTVQAAAIRCRTDRPRRPAGAAASGSFRPVSGSAGGAAMRQSVARPYGIVNPPPTEGTQRAQIRCLQRNSSTRWPVRRSRSGETGRLQARPVSCAKNLHDACRRGLVRRSAAAR